ncbi:hypothetical protein MRB53_040474 [Persea americana]|nr:hypothetical protein MRB53_040474 [Persea americana]
MAPNAGRNVSAFVSHLSFIHTDRHADLVQEKRFRSMQEHIRRAHKEYYIPKLPATEDSFLRMVNTPLSERPPPEPSPPRARP